MEDDNVEEEDRSQDREAHFVGACAIKIDTDMSEGAFCVEIRGKMPDANSAASILCELAQKK